jgi:RHS repeat-associated protein
MVIEALTSGRRQALLVVISAAIAVLPPAVTSAQDEVVYYHIDAIGSVRMVTDASGAVIARYDYLPFGERFETVPPATYLDQRQFAGKERDSETGLDYFGARFLRGESGRFITTDPVLNTEAALSDPQRWNRYAYSLNNPLRFIDPDGREVRPLDSLALERIRSTVPSSLRSSIVVGTSGALDTTRLNSVKTNDANFGDLRSLANGTTVVEVATAAGLTGGGDFLFESVETLRAEIVKFGLPASAITGPNSYLGQTSENRSSIRVTLSDGSGRASSAPSVEHAVTTAHELYGHALPRAQGKPWQHEQSNSSQRPVNQHIGIVESRTRRLYDKLFF